MNLVTIKLDCDNDTFLVQVNPEGNTCHTGSYNCWQESKNQNFNFLSKLENTISERKKMPMLLQVM
ncbi:bifunctional phosphoribosyl-AMP cyclohydrolase/phosphoribosyl-ATP diphosphatase [Flavobacterium psychrophilum]|nr:bifunctional phosphoribosyl-AMP cyclohydrolase/phosphoribosyl-ATP diphosphatase [Flavobacterium psychrophilum]